MGEKHIYIGTIAHNTTILLLPATHGEMVVVVVIGVVVVDVLIDAAVGTIPELWNKQSKPSQPTVALVL